MIAPCIRLWKLLPRRFAISHRNRWMVESADVVVAYVLMTGAALPQRCGMPAEKEKNHFIL